MLMTPLPKVPYPMFMVIPHLISVLIFRSYIACIKKSATQIIVKRNDITIF